MNETYRLVGLILMVTGVMLLVCAGLTALVGAVFLVIALPLGGTQEFLLVAALSAMVGGAFYFAGRRLRVK